MTHQPFKQWLFVEVPEGASSELINIGKTRFLLRWYLPDFSDAQDIPLPSSNYTIIGKGDELNGSDWDKIVDGWDDTDKDRNPILCYQNYEMEYRYHNHFDNPKDSGYSLLKSLGLEKPEQVLVLLNNKK